MSIQNVVRVADSCIPLYRGTTGTPTVIFTENISGGNGKSPSCHVGSVWFKGKLFTVKKGAYNSYTFTRYDLATDTWTDNALTMTPIEYPSCLPALIVHKDRVYIFFDEEGPVNAAYNNHKIRGAWYDADMVTEDNGAARYYENSYDKGTNGYQDINHVHDVVVHKGVFYIAGSYGIYTNIPNSNTISAHWEIQESGAGGRILADKQTAKSLGVFEHDLYCLFSNGMVNKLGGAFEQKADLNNTITGNSGIITGVNLTGGTTVTSIGYGCYLFQGNNQLHAFVNASGANGSGIVSFSSANGTDWTQTTKDVVPTAWRNQIGHIHGCNDPSNNEKRILFLNADNNAGVEEFVFNGSGTELTSLGAINIPDFYTYNFWNDDAVDVESKDVPTVGLTKAVATYTLYNESSGISNITPKYSTDNGGTWHTATRKTGEGSGLTNLSSETLENGGKEYVFVWDYRTDLGYDIEYTNVKLQFITSVV